MNTKVCICFFSTLALSFSASADKLMTKAQYTDYSVKYRCIELTYHDDIDKKEEAMIALDDSYGLTDDNFDDFDELITEYERDSALLEAVAMRAKTECSKA